MALLKSLPPRFTAAAYFQKAAQSNIPKTIAYRILKLFMKEDLVIKKSYNNYVLKETKDIWGDQLSEEEN